MITIPSYIKLPEIVPHGEIHAWKEKNRAFWLQTTCPDEVRAFIDAMATKLGDFAQYQVHTTMMKGEDLLLCGIKTVKGEQVFSFASYPIDVPVMQRVDYYGTLMRIYRKRGKQGLIDFCKVKVKGSELERVLEILHVHVFHQERPEFRQVLKDIEQSKPVTA